MYNFNTLFGNHDAPSQALPSNLIAPGLGEVSTREVAGRLQVAATVAMGVFQVGDGESCVTGLALDASQSMQDDYGRGRTITPEAKQKFMQEGKFEEKTRDGVSRRVLTREARQMAIDNGWTDGEPVPDDELKYDGFYLEPHADGIVFSGCVALNGT